MRFIALLLCIAGLSSAMMSSKPAPQPPDFAQQWSNYVTAVENYMVNSTKANAILVYEAGEYFKQFSDLEAELDARTPGWSSFCQNVASLGYFICTDNIDPDGPSELQYKYCKKTWTQYYNYCMSHPPSTN